jgi:hypothetical protein
MFVGFWRYGVVDAIASWRGQPTARAQDRALRQEAAAKAAHERRQANLGPTVGQALAARSRSASPISAAGNRNHRGSPTRCTGWRRTGGWTSSTTPTAATRAADGSPERRAAARRPSGHRRRGAREADIVDGEVVEEVHWCAACRRHEVPQDGWRCPDCARSGYGEQTPPVDPPDDGASEDIEHPHCIRHDMSWRGNGGCPACAPATSGRHCSTCTERLDPSEAGPKCAFCLIPDLTPPPLRRCSTCECNLYDWEPGPDCQGCEVGIQVPNRPRPRHPRVGRRQPRSLPVSGLRRDRGLPAGPLHRLRPRKTPVSAVPQPWAPRRRRAVLPLRRRPRRGRAAVHLPAMSRHPRRARHPPLRPVRRRPVPGPDQAAAPETSEPTPGPDTTTGGTPTMTQANVIDGDINDPTGAKRFTDANAATLRAIADQCELMIARSRGEARQRRRPRAGTDPRRHPGLRRHHRPGHRRVRQARRAAGQHRRPRRPR